MSKDGNKGFIDALNEELKLIDTNTHLTDDWEEDLWHIEFRIASLQEFMGVGKKIFGHSHKVVGKIDKYMAQLKREKRKTEEKIAQIDKK